MAAVEAIFSPPHRATKSEVLRISARARDIGITAWRAHEEVQTHYVRMTTIYDLYALRGDADMMKQIRQRIIDEALVLEIGYRDVILMV